MFSPSRYAPPRPSATRSLNSAKDRRIWEWRRAFEATQVLSKTSLTVSMSQMIDRLKRYLFSFFSDIEVACKFPFKILQHLLMLASIFNIWPLFLGYFPCLPLPSFTFPCCPCLSWFLRLDNKNCRSLSTPDLIYCLQSSFKWLNHKHGKL